MSTRHCFGICGPLVALVVLFLLPSPTSAEEPLSISISSSRESCTVGTFTEISWRISGGAAPYELVVNGNVVDSELASERVLCTQAESLADSSQLHEPNQTAIRATVTDAANQSASDSLVLPLFTAAPAAAQGLCRRLAGMARLSRRHPIGWSGSADRGVPKPEAASVPVSVSLASSRKQHMELLLAQ